MQKKLKIVQQITRRKELSAQRTSQRILSLFCFPKRERNWKRFSWLPNERNYLLNGLQNNLQIVQLITKQKKLSAQWISKFKSDYFVFKKSKRNWKQLGRLLNERNVLLNELQNILQDYNSVFKKCKTNLKTVQLNSKRKKLSTHWNAKRLEGF